jgi:hypothetical protein
MSSRRSAAKAAACAVTLALAAVIATPSAVMAGQGPPGNCANHAGASAPYCTYFQPNQGQPGLAATFWMQCPTSDNQGEYPVAVDHIVPYVTNNGQYYPVTPVGHLNNGEGGYYNPGAGATAWYNDVVIPNLSEYPAVLDGWGYCVFFNDQYDIGLVEDVPVSYFFVSGPTTDKYVFPPKEYLYLSFGAIFGGVQLLGGEAFRVLSLAGQDDLTVTTTPDNNEPKPKPKPKPKPTPPGPTTTTTTTRPRPTTTTSTTLGRRAI